MKSRRLMLLHLNHAVKTNPGALAVSFQSNPIARTTNLKRTWNLLGSKKNLLGSKKNLLGSKKNLLGSKKSHLGFNLKMNPSSLDRKRTDRCLECVSKHFGAQLCIQSVRFEWFQWKYPLYRGKTWFYVRKSPQNPISTSPGRLI